MKTRKQCKALFHLFLWNKLFTQVNNNSAWDLKITFGLFVCLFFRNTTVKCFLCENSSRYDRPYIYILVRHSITFNPRHTWLYNCHHVLQKKRLHLTKQEKLRSTNSWDWESYCPLHFKYHVHSMGKKELSR